MTKFTELTNLRPVQAHLIDIRFSKIPSLLHRKNYIIKVSHSLD